MDLKQLQAYLDAPETAGPWMNAIGIANAAGGMRNIRSIAAHDSTLEFMGDFVDLLSPLVYWSPDPDMVLNNLERFFQATRSPKTLVLLFLQDVMSLSMLLEIFATSQYLGDMLIAEPELFETVRQSDGLPKSQRQLTDELVEEIMTLEKESSVLRALRRFKRRQTLRIAFGDIIKKQSLEVVTNQISRVAVAVVEASLQAAGRKLFHKRGTPRTERGHMAHFTVLALGKLGGRELNYSSDIDLMFLYDREGQTDPDQESIDNSQYFSELGRELVRLMAEQTDLGAAYRVDMRLRPNGKHGPLAIGFDEAIRYYDNRGRTWERQAFIKARPIAGNIELGNAFLQRLEPWIYRRNITQADIAGIRTLKRRIERNAIEAGDELLNVKTGYGGIRDIEFMVQFLQLLHGGELPALRTGNTLTAIDRLAENGCLQPQEKDLMSESYRFLRKIEHRLQIMFDLQTHVMPDGIEERRKLALRMGYNDMSWQTALDAFNADFKFMTDADRRMLNHLLVNAFHDDVETAAEVDLLLEPEPEESQIRSVLGKYHFSDPLKAYQLLSDLMDEKNPYLSARRCRHFLIAIAPELLKAISETPVPDQTLTTLTTVADALGAKGGLWELFSFNTPSLTLFVRLCAYAPFLTDMLRRDPGMLDGLMDSLVLDKIPDRDVLDEHLTLLCTNAEQLEPILNGFKNDRILHVGTRNILGRSSIKETTAAISDIAQLCLKQIIVYECRKLVARHGTPSLDDPSDSNTHWDATGQYFHPCRFVVVALGKLGGREMNYHSDLDLLFFYEKDGRTSPVFFDEQGGLCSMDESKTQIISNQEFFNLLTRNVVKQMTLFSSWGKLYDVDLRLRPRGKGGTLATSREELLRYFQDGTGALWERQMLCKARVVFSSDLITRDSEKGNFPKIARRVMEMVREVQYALPLNENWIEQIRDMRKRLQESSREDQIKRGAGGTVDVEFIVQMLQLKYGQARPGINIPNTFDAIERLYATNILETADYLVLSEGYRFLRTLESFLCLLNQPSSKQLPQDEVELKKLAFLAGFSSSEKLKQKFEKTTTQIVECFDRIFRNEKNEESVQK